jgi:hypothetical protein
VREHGADCAALPAGEFCRERDVDFTTGIAHVRDVQARSGILDDDGDRVPQSARKNQVVVNGDVVPANVPGVSQVDFRSRWSS